MNITPFVIRIEDAALVDLRDRLARTRWPERPALLAGDIRRFFRRLRQET